MLQLVEDGPEIPQKVLEALEEERLVFFCGSGISAYTGLPLFPGLVEEVLRLTASALEGPEQTCFEKKQYDRTLGLLERRLIPYRMREAVIAALEKPRALPLATHEALLELARIRNGFRLVTTNFDRCFLETGLVPESQISKAPSLPPPKAYSWASLVHLHGLICGEDPRGVNLVVTSADFGRAYLSEAWACRFVVELFRGFTVLFVGYGVDDPVMTYLVDALAAERALGQPFSESFALAGYAEGERPRVVEDWSAKGITAIPYPEADSHIKLHATLTHWSRLKRGGLTSRIQIATEEARHEAAPPGSPGAKRLAWALSQESGAVATAFANLDPPAPLSWLETLERTELEVRSAALEPCSLLGLSSPVTLEQNAPGTGLSVRIAGSSVSHVQPLTPSTKGLCLWLTRHLGERGLLNWVLRHGAVMHPEFADRVAWRLGQKDTVVGPALRQCWELLVSERYANAVRNPRRDYGPALRTLRGDRFAPADRLEVLEALRPVPVPRPQVEIDPASLGQPAREATVGALVSLDIEFSLQHAGWTLIPDLKRHPYYLEFVAATSDELTSLLRECLVWFEVFGHAAHDYDLTYLYQPSIEAHAQNHYLHEWTHLVDLARDSLAGLMKQDTARGQALVLRWAGIPYPVFDRLVIHAGTKWRRFRRETLRVLRRDHTRALWSSCCEHEVLQFLREGSGSLLQGERSTLEQLILKGPPREQFREDISSEDLASVVDRSIWLRLSRFRENPAGLSVRGNGVLLSLCKRYEWKLELEERQEFPVWMGAAEWGQGAMSDTEYVTSLPRSEALTEISRRIEKGPPLGWTEARLLGQKRPSVALALLRRDSFQSLPDAASRGLLEGLATTSDTRKSRQLLAIVDRDARRWTIGTRTRVSGGIATLLERNSKVPDCLDTTGSEAAYDLWEIAWEASAGVEESNYEDSLTNAINHPAGKLVEALVHVLSAYTAKERPVPKALRYALQQVVNGSTVSARLGRSVLATNLAYLFHVDRSLVVENLIPHFDWAVPAEAKAVWEGFLYSPRVNPDILAALRPFLVTTTKHLDMIPGQLSDALAQLVGAIATQMPEALPSSDATAMLRRLHDRPRAALVGVFIATLRATETEDKARHLWSDVIQPWLKACWPTDRGRNGEQVVVAMVGLALAQPVLFVEVSEFIRPFLFPCEQAVVMLIGDSGEDDQLLQAHPATTATLLEALLPETVHMFIVPRLREAIEVIRRAFPESGTDPKFRELADRVSRLDSL
jgi:hypothetical protein